MNKEHNFISAVVYLGNCADENIRFFDVLHQQLEQHFQHYEIIGVVPGKTVDTAPVREWAKQKASQPITLLHMSPNQTQEQCMNAGLDVSIGDYIYEFDTTELPYDADMIWKAYEVAVEGSDIVTVCPEHSRNGIYYRLFNRFSRTEHQIRTDLFHLLSRRALNRVHAINENLPYRKAAYATCGLKMTQLTFPGSVQRRGSATLDLASDSLVLYTNFGYKFSIGITLLMLLSAIAELIYTLVIWLTGRPVSGWTTTMFVLTAGMTGIFAVLAIILKFLTLLLKLVFQRQHYFVESVEKL